MNTQDFISKLTSEKLNEAMFRKFGTKVNFESYDREDLEKYRNLLRTKIHQTESSSKFNDLLSNNVYQKDKFMLDVLNTRIKEMLGEGAKVDRQAKHITASMMKKGKSKDEAEQIAWAHIKHPKKNKKAEEGIEETNMNKTTEGKKIDQNKDGKNDWEDIKIARMKASGAMPKDKKVKEAFPTVDDAKKNAQGTAGMKQGEKKKSSTGGEITKTATGLTHAAGKNYGGKDAPKTPDSDKKKMKEGHYKLHVRLVNESLRYLIQEDEEGKAKAITAASDMVNDFTTWMQRVGQYQTKSMIELADSIRGEFGQAESDAFKNAISPALAATIETLTQQREAISHAVAVLAGEATDAPMGDAAGIGGELPLDAGDDTMNPTDEMPAPEDEFSASDAAAGGAETSGRMTRESRQMSKLRKIAESHSIMAKLAR